MKRIFAHIGLSMAVSLLVLNIIGVRYVPVLCASIGVLFLTSLLLPKYRKAAALLLTLGASLFGGLLFLAVYYGTVQPCLELDAQSANAAFYMIGLPEKTDFGYAYVAKTLWIDKVGAVQNIKLRIVTDGLLTAKPYQVLQGELKFFSLGNGAFSSYGYWGKGIFLTSRIKDYSVTGEVIASPMQPFLTLKAWMITTLTENIRGDGGALAAALTTGSKAHLSDAVYRYFIYSGTSHLMAVSGLHLTVVTGAVGYLTEALHLPKKAGSIVTVISVLAFAALTGFAKSVIRAGVMMIVLASAPLFGRRGDTLNSLGFAVFLICLNPFAVTDVGAVFSVLSVLALTTAYPEINRRTAALKAVLVKKHIRSLSLVAEFLEYILNALLGSVCILAFSLPAVYLFFGYLSVAGVLANLLMIPLGSLTTVLSFLACLTSKAGALGDGVFAADGVVTQVLINLARLFSFHGKALVSSGRYFGLFLACVLTVVALCFMLNHRRMVKAMSLCGVLLLAVYLGSNAVFMQHAAEVYITKSGACAVVCQDETLVVGVKNKSDYYAISSFLESRHSDADLLVLGGKDAMNEKLAQTVGCQKALGYCFNAAFLEIADEEYIVKSDYEETLNGRLSVSLRFSNEGYLYTVRVNGRTLSNDDARCDIYLNNKTALDSKGTINLQDGDVVYTVSGNGALTAERMDLWQN